MEKFLEAKLRQAEAKLPTAAGYQREALVAGLSLGRTMLGYYRSPERERPADFEKRVSRALLLIGEGGAFD